MVNCILNTRTQRPGKILARKGTNVAKITSGERGTLVTTCCIVSANGQALRPVTVFSGKKFKPHMLHGAPAGTLGLAAPTGWMNADIFVDVMRHFVKHVSASKANPVLLLMDNHESHLSIETLNLAKSSGVTILTLHPHTTSKLQPLDVGVYGPFKTYYNAAVDSWLLRNPGQSLTIYNVAECVGSAYLKAMTPVNIVNAFKKCGIFPFDDSCFTEADFFPSTVTDRHFRKPSNAEETPKKSEIVAPILNDSQNSNLQLNSTIQNNTATVTQDSDVSPSILMSQEYIEKTPPHLLDSLNVPVASPRFLQSSTPTPTRNFISPIDFLPSIKAQPRKMKRCRVPGKSIIATDTPEKDAIAEKKNRENKKQVHRVKQGLFKGVNKIRKELDKSKKKAYNVDTSDEDEAIANGSSFGGEEFTDQNDEEDEVISLDRNFLSIPRDPKVNEFVLVIFPLKKIEVYYVAKILEIIDDDEDDSDFFVSSLRLKSRTRQTFCEPIVPDLTGIQRRDIKYILPHPKITGSSRRPAFFLFDIHFNMTELNLR